MQRNSPLGPACVVATNVIVWLHRMSLPRMIFSARFHASLAGMLIWVAAACIACAGEGAALLARAHSHNDYEHPRPLLDALDQGFCSVEADIWLQGGELLVAHNRSQLATNRSLESLYLEPLRQRVRQNGGRVFKGGPEFSLLIDLKTDWKTTYPALRGVLTNYADILTTFEDGERKPGAVLVVLSGSRSKEMFGNEPVRFAAYDGELTDLESDPPATLVPWVSANWKANFKWRGTGPIPPDEKKRLDDIVDRAHRQGRKVRFWGAPDVPEFWRAMLAARVDLINTDKLEELRSFLAGGSTE